MNAIAPPPQCLYSAQHTVVTPSLRALLAEARSALLSAWHAPESLIAVERQDVFTRLTLVLDPVLISRNARAEEILPKLDSFCADLKRNQISFVVGYDPRSQQTRLQQGTKPAHIISIQLFTKTSGHSAQGMPSF